MRFALALALVMLTLDAPAADVSLGAEVAANTWKAVRLRGLPKDASLAVRVEASGPLVVVLVHEEEVKRFPNPVRPAFTGALERRLAFRVTVPLAGNYYVIFDNRKGAEARRVRVRIQALPARSPAPAPKAPGARKLEAT